METIPRHYIVCDRAIRKLTASDQPRSLACGLAFTSKRRSSAAARSVASVRSCRSLLDALLQCYLMHTLRLTHAPHLI